MRRANIAALLFALLVGGAAQVTPPAQPAPFVLPQPGQLYSYSLMPGEKVWLWRPVKIAGPLMLSRDSSGAAVLSGPRMVTEAFTIPAGASSPWTYTLAHHMASGTVPLTVLNCVVAVPLSADYSSLALQITFDTQANARSGTVIYWTFE